MSRTAIPRACPVALLGLTLAPALLSAAGGEAAAASPAGALRDCVIIPTAAERLACYDRLAGRSAAGAEAPAASVSPGAPAAGATEPLPNPAPAPAATAAAPGATPAAGTVAATPAAPATSYGLYAVEHPAPPPVPAELTARVSAVGKSESGRMTVALEGGALWELADSDALLAVGDAVSIRRAALGSFLMVTPTKRVHRARRLR